MKMKLPMRFRILQLICNGDQGKNTIDSKKIKEIIFKEYGNERQCKDKTIKNHLLALKAVGLIEEISVTIENGKFVSQYAATGEGLKRLNLIPKYAK
ncbi:hypothetical protein [Clostridium sp. JN-9]|uniref:hypothetical protein n=1 Tax=Clostridium sp. JN-9 TaxID=2507159 RepID=UPI000FFE0EAD|nr:hypothetical protein [Clostridium sp. JN-9]QAT39913.1 hypothetical protein EQM05_06440 [Clostridium sp. JN-9]